VLPSRLFGEGERESEGLLLMSGKKRETRRREVQAPREGDDGEWESLAGNRE
jgi:hypothetical protein